MTKAVPASPTLAYLIPGGAFASGQGYYVDRSPRGLLRQLVHRGALCRTGVSWFQPPHPTPNPEAAVRPARGPCGQAMLSRWPPERQAERKTFNPPTPVQKGSRTPLAKCSGREGGKTRDAGRSERTLGQPSCEAIKVEGRGGRHVLQTCLGQPTVARLAQAERAHAL